MNAIVKGVGPSAAAVGGIWSAARPVGRRAPGPERGRRSALKGDRRGAVVGGGTGWWVHGAASLGWPTRRRRCSRRRPRRRPPPARRPSSGPRSWPRLRGAAPARRPLGRRALRASGPAAPREVARGRGGELAEAVRPASCSVADRRSPSGARPPPSGPARWRARRGGRPGQRRRRRRRAGRPPAPQVVDASGAKTSTLPARPGPAGVHHRQPVGRR